jgi:glycosyltransferase involved in cell wall biosynthesis
MKRSATSGVPLLLAGVLCALTGFALFVATSLFDFAGLPAAPILYRSCGVLVWTGIALAAADLFVLLPAKRQPPLTVLEQPTERALTVVLTAYNDAPSIAAATADFLAHPLVRRVVVVDNNSTDATAAEAARAGARVVHEPLQGYGHAVHRALSEGAAQNDTEMTLLCEGDCTFRAYDIDKFLAYIPHADIVNGTRIVEQLRARDTQLTTFMYYGNFFVGKLLEAKHIGKGTFTDVGTTYKLCWNSALRRLLPMLNPAVDLEFNAHFLDTALAGGFRLLECPVTFHNRVGESKGGNVDNARAFAVGVRMIRGILFGWPRGGRG